MDTLERGLTSNRQHPNAVAISVAGGTGNSTLFLVDGGYNNDSGNNTGNAMPFPDALQEFRTETGVRPARYGMYTGATVNAVTRSGSQLSFTAPCSTLRVITHSTRFRISIRRKTAAAGRTTA